VKRSFILVFTVLLALGWLSAAPDKPYCKWTLDEAVRVLNDSPWATKETFTHVVGGIGSGVQGEKELYNTYYVRLLSAKPIREAFARIRQLQLHYDTLTEGRKKAVDRQIAAGLKLDVRHWIVVAVAYRSNNPQDQAGVDRFFQDQTTETMRNRAFLSSERLSRVELFAYYPPKEGTVGAKFVFPRVSRGVPVVKPADKQFVFEFDTPGSGPQLRARFSITEMIVDGELVL
jgi:hypothetical protein